MNQPKQMWSGRLQSGTVKKIKKLAKKRKATEAAVVDHALSCWGQTCERVAKTFNLDLP